MNGPHHFLTAERLLHESDVETGELMVGADPDVLARNIARAQVHATLALAAATALGTTRTSETNSELGDMWRAVAG